MNTDEHGFFEAKLFEGRKPHDIRISVEGWEMLLSELPRAAAFEFCICR